MRRWRGLGMMLVFGMLMGTAPAATGAEQATVKLDEVVVTATRTETDIDKVGGTSVTVITAEEIQTKGYMTVEEVLKGAPGIDIKANGGPGSLTSVSIRGADSKNTLVLVDGIIVNDASSISRQADLANLTTDNIERIEIVRGPQSVLYGSNATAGVINIITRKGKDKPEIYAGTEAGSYNTWKAYGGASGELGGVFNFALAASQTETGGFSIANADNDRIPQGTNSDEDDGWRNTTFSGRLGLDIEDRFAFGVTLRHMDSTVDADDFDFAGYAVDNSFGPGRPEDSYQDSEQTFFRTDIKAKFLDGRLSTSVYYNKAIQDREFYDNNKNLESTYESETDEVGGQVDLNFEHNVLSMGAVFLSEGFESDIEREKTANTDSFWIQNQFFWQDWFELVAGLRMDDHEEFGSETTYRIAPSFTLPFTGSVLKGAYATGFRTPSLYELYADAVPAWFFAGGNKQLEPETSKGWEVGIEQPFWQGRLKLGTTYFEMRFEDRIRYITDPVTWQGSYDNLDGTSKSRGLESFIAWQASDRLDLRLDHTYTHSVDSEGERLFHHPLNKVRFNVGYRPVDSLKLNLDIQWVDERDEDSSFNYDKDGNPVRELDAYTLVNLSARYRLNKYLELYGRVENLFDEFYEEAWSYATPGLSAYAGIRVSY
ncbi:MAG: TonB-dependent receptor [Desulfobacteraceae bacterium]|nr:TonB-dependent receptor [Desulfobacteraceae bacterium]